MKQRLFAPLFRYYAHHLLLKYEQGTTSLLQEQWLRSYILNSAHPSFEPYRPLFAYFAVQKTEPKTTVIKNNSWKRYSIVAAASICLAIGLSTTYYISQSTNYYVWDNGDKYNSKELALQTMRKNLDEILEDVPSIEKEIQQIITLQ